MRFKHIVHALTITLVISIGACVPDDVTDATEGKHAVVDPVLETLALSGDWEVAANSVILTDQAQEDHVPAEEIGELTQSALAEIAERDLAWYAADGERYDALYIHENGKAYGRRMARYSANRNPEETNNFGAFQGVGGSGDDVFGDSAIGHNTTSGGFASGLGDVAQARISTNWQDDRRYRVSTGMTTYPTRVIGALSGSGNTQSGGCSGTKVGPRAVLTAAHCVMNSSGSISLSGRFNPGQTSTTTPNGSLSWSGVFLRDWRIHRRYDYAIIYLADSPTTVGLGWMGVVWWNGSSGYNGRSSKLFGYPCGANMGCGATTVQMCKASPRTDKRCDGWMYGHSRTLNSNSFRSDELLQYDNDMSSGQSGSAVWTWYGSSAAVMAVNTHSWSGVSMGPRFRQSMWNDVCSWIAHPSKQSAYATHSLCN